MGTFYQCKILVSVAGRVCLAWEVFSGEESVGIIQLIKENHCNTFCRCFSFSFLELLQFIDLSNKNTLFVYFPSL